MPLLNVPGILGNVPRRPITAARPAPPDLPRDPDRSHVIPHAEPCLARRSGPSDIPPAGARPPPSPPSPPPSSSPPPPLSSPPRSLRLSSTPTVETAPRVTRTRAVLSAPPRCVGHPACRRAPATLAAVLALALAAAALARAV
ncbi:uncharacterized protein TRAVEDRAFT_43052 [Trametes versicolor FP-101664 SS1]|uniref:uncharacterized protein n=1 Tax=Trametes versicolor (strain FP-101664) TaxID=717944 RepID=UPI0004622302|nr:uncharacterized protein TRAVEDRAFT_43052 [Trametes versicolor FP-101664 SS1]EIW62716.1 hypothetical protein TRAVEDRAFT_43052 [Trametes versicolor FP-101664 SS1]